MTEVQTLVKKKYRYVYKEVRILCFFWDGNILRKSHCFEHVSPQSLAQMISMVEYNSNFIIYCIL
jgi:hypothetical protein